MSSTYDNQNNTRSETAEEMMEVDGQPENAKPDDDQPPDYSDDEDYGVVRKVDGQSGNTKPDDDQPPDYSDDEDNGAVRKVDGQSGNAKPNNVLLPDYSDDEDNGVGDVSFDRVFQCYVPGILNRAEGPPAGATALIVYTTKNDDEDTSDVERNLRNIITSVVDGYMNNEDVQPVLQFAQEQLFIDWCTSRHILTNRDPAE